MSKTKIILSVITVALALSMVMVGCGRRNNGTTSNLTQGGANNNGTTTAPGNNGVNENGANGGVNENGTVGGENSGTGNGDLNGGVNIGANNQGQGNHPLTALGNTIDNVYNDVMQGGKNWLDTIDENAMKTSYNMDFSNFDEYYGRIPRANTHATSVIGVKVKNGKKADTRAELMKYQAAMEKNFERYLPDQYDMVKDYRIIENGDYMILVIAENADDVETAFGKAFKEMK